MEFKQLLSILLLFFANNNIKKKTQTIMEADRNKNIVNCTLSLPQYEKRTFTLELAMADLK